MNTRLQQFIAAENISQAQLADTLQVARAGISHILAGRNKPSYDFLTSLMQRFPQLNIEWLMFGKGKMYKNEAPAQEREKQNEPSLLFNDYDLFEEHAAPTPEADNTLPEPQVEIKNKISNEIESLGNALQLSAKQRNVKKIIILFDDGTFQEM